MIEFVKRINEDTPFYEQGVAKDIFSWKELENLLNLRPFVNNKRFNFINSESHMFEREAWLTDLNSWPAKKLDKVINDAVCYIRDCSRASKKINDICELIENEWNYPTDAHIFFSLVEGEKGEGLKSHWDFSHNIIIQVEGESNFKVWNEKYKEGDHFPKPKTEPVIDVVMKTGDLIFIPKYMLHQVIPLSKRLSVSFPMNNDTTIKSQDRHWIQLKNGE